MIWTWKMPVELGILTFTLVIELVPTLVTKVKVSLVVAFPPGPMVTGAV